MARRIGTTILLLGVVAFAFSLGTPSRASARYQNEETSSASVADETPDNEQSETLESNALGESKTGRNDVEFLKQDELLRLFDENNEEVDAAKAGENMRKIMSAKDPDDESGKITIPAYAEEPEYDFDSDEDDDAINFLSFRHDDGNFADEDEFDDETEEEDLAKLFGDSESASNDPDGAKGGA